MKKILAYASIALLLGLIFSSGCTKSYDDSALWDKMNSMDARLKEIEQKCDRMNTNILSIQSLVTALQNRDFITSVSPIVQGEITIGYTISFGKANPITIYNGKDGQDGHNGTNGTTPTISVKQDTDGIWYWTVNGEWLLANGEKVKAEAHDGSNGQNGITPKFKIEEGYWFVSYDNGSSWNKLDKAIGDSGLNGEDGESFFNGVELQDGYVVFTLNDKDQTKIKLPYYKEGKLALHSEYEGHIKTLLTDDICRSITNLTVTGIFVPDDVQYLANQMLSLEILDLSGTNLTNIPKGGFCKGDLKYGKDSLREVYLPETCTEIGSYAFYGCTNLRKFVANNATAAAIESPFSHIYRLNYVSLGRSDGAFKNTSIKHLDLFGDSFSETNANTTIDTLVFKYINREENGKVSIVGTCCKHITFDEQYDLGIQSIYIQNGHELILPISLKKIEYANTVGTIDTVVVKSNASLDSYSHCGLIKAFYWYPDHLPSTLKNQYPSVYKVEAFYVRKSLLASFKEKFTNFTFLALEDSDYYKAHPNL